MNANITNNKLYKHFIKTHEDIRMAIPKNRMAVCRQGRDNCMQLSIKKT